MAYGLSLYSIQIILSDYQGLFLPGVHIPRFNQDALLGWLALPVGGCKELLRKEARAFSHHP